jgi:hypothetical protein
MLTSRCHSFLICESKSSLDASPPPPLHFAHAVIACSIRRRCWYMTNCVLEGQGWPMKVEENCRNKNVRELVITRCDLVAYGLGMQKTLLYFFRDFLSRFYGFSAFGRPFLDIVEKKCQLSFCNDFSQKKLRQNFDNKFGQIFDKILTDFQQSFNSSCQNSDSFLTEFWRSFFKLGTASLYSVLISW